MWRHPRGHSGIATTYTSAVSLITHLHTLPTSNPVSVFHLFRYAHIVINYHPPDCWCIDKKITIYGQNWSKKLQKIECDIPLSAAATWPYWCSPTWIMILLNACLLFDDWKKKRRNTIELNSSRFFCLVNIWTRSCYLLYCWARN